jgi:hypothetical protein
MVEVCQIVVRWCMMVYDGRSVADGCPMVSDGVGWLYREGLSDMVKMVQMVYDGRSVSFGVGCLYYVPI